MRKRRSKYKPPEIPEKSFKMGPISQVTTTNVLKGCVISIAGKLSRSHDETIDFIEKNGGTFTRQISNKVFLKKKFLIF